MTALAGATLPPVAQDGYREGVEYRGGMTIMASGSMARDLLSATGKRAFELSWVSLSAANVATVLSAYEDIVAADGTFVAPTGVSYTVQPADQNPVSVSWHKAAGALKADVSLRLRQA